jgi:hypothetical protein
VPGSLPPITSADIVILMTNTECTARQILADARDLHGDLILFRDATRKTTSPRGAMLIKQQIMDEKVKIWGAIDTLRNLRAHA